MICITQAFWLSLQDDLELPQPCYVRVIRVLREIRDGISEVGGASESAAIKEEIDIDFIEKKANADVFEWKDCQSLIRRIVDIIRRLQSPRRDADLTEKFNQTKADLVSADSDISARPRIFCKALEFLLDRVNLIRIDNANAR